MPVFSETPRCKKCDEPVRVIKIRGEKVMVDELPICVFQAPGDFSRMRHDVSHVVYVFGKRWGVQCDENEPVICTTLHSETCGKKHLGGIWKSRLTADEAAEARAEADRSMGDMRSPTGLIVQPLGERKEDK